MVHFLCHFCPSFQYLLGNLEAGGLVKLREGTRGIREENKFKRRRRRGLVNQVTFCHFLPSFWFVSCCPVVPSQSSRLFFIPLDTSSLVWFFLMTAWWNFFVLNVLMFLDNFLLLKDRHRQKLRVLFLKSYLLPMFFFSLFVLLVLLVLQKLWLEWTGEKVFIWLSCWTNFWSFSSRLDMSLVT